MSRPLKVSPDVMFRELQGEAVLLDLKSQKYFGLDAVGTRIWQLLETETPRTAMLDALLEEFEVSRDQLRADLSAFLERLEAAGLIQLEARGPGQDREGDTESP
ncbi:MAG: PqqD family protein [Acidobacteria bacterium]|nr:PqqD family protein [Acidobacteriota bacterium]